MSELTTIDPFDITVKSNGLRRRRIVEKIFGVLAVASAVLACGILVIVLGTLVAKGFSALSLDFFTKPRPLFGEKGGIADALIGSALIVGMAMLMAIPMAVLVAIYVSEYARPRVARALKVVLDVLNGVPAIVVGIFVFGILVVGRGQSAVLRRLRTRDPHDSDGRSRDTGDPRGRSTESARCELRARRHQVAHDLEHRPSRGHRRHPHRRGDCRRARCRRDGTASLHVVDRGELDLVRHPCRAAHAARPDLQPTPSHQTLVTRRPHGRQLSS